MYGVGQTLPGCEGAGLQTKSVEALGYNSLKTEQEAAITSFASGKDVFVILPTGFGKTLCDDDDACLHGYDYNYEYHYHY